MTQTTTSEPKVLKFQDCFDNFLASKKSEPSWLKKRREAAFAQLKTLGFPDRKNEAWKYTPVTKMLAPNYVLPHAPHLSGAEAVLGKSVYWDEGAVRIVFIDGVFCPQLSVLDDVPEGLTVCSMSDLLAKDASRLEEAEGRHVEHLNDGFRALNSAFSDDGAFIEVKANQQIDVPIHILYLNGCSDFDVMCHPRNIVALEQGAQCTIVERYAGINDQACYLLNSMTEFWLARDSQVEHCRIQLESEAAFHVGVSEVHQETNSSFKSVSVVTGAKVGRTEMFMEQGGPHTHCEVNGLYVMDGDRVADQFIVAHHTQDASRSEQFFKGIMSDRSVGIFNGAIIAEEGVKGTDAHQTNKNLLLSDDATAETRPQLEIYCDDIACSHGATVGQLDQESLFYLQSRGIAEVEARGMLTRAFAGDVVEKITIPKIKEQLETFLSERVAKHSSNIEIGS